MENEAVLDPPPIRDADALAGGPEHLIKFRVDVTGLSTLRQKYVEG
jgi:hypothetical protein